MNLIDKLIFIKLYSNMQLFERKIISAGVIKNT